MELEGPLDARNESMTSLPPPIDGKRHGQWGLEQYRLNLSLLCDAAQNIGATPVLLTQARLVSPDSEEHERLASALELTGLSLAGLNRAFEDCDRILEVVAEAKGARFLDLASALMHLPELYADHVHTTAEGSEAIARQLAGSLSLWIEEDRKRKSSR